MISKEEKTTWSKETIFNRPYAEVKGCKCGHKFRKREVFVVSETKVSWFRGDDEVEFLCVSCAPSEILKVMKLKRKTS